MNVIAPVASIASSDTLAATQPLLAKEDVQRRVLLAHRGRLGADGLKSLIERANLNFDVQTVSGSDQALALLNQEPGFDLALIALGANAIQELDAIGTFAADHPETPVILIIPDDAAPHVTALTRRGVRGVVLDSTPGNTLGAVLQLVLLGGVYVPASLSAAGAVNGAIRFAQAEHRRGQRGGGLTPRQAEVLRLVARGFSNKAISRELNMQESTVKAHVNHIMRKLKVRNRTQAALMASQPALAAELHL